MHIKLSYLSNLYKYFLIYDKNDIKSVMIEFIINFILYQSFNITLIYNPIFYLFSIYYNYNINSDKQIIFYYRAKILFT